MLLSDLRDLNTTVLSPTVSSNVSNNHSVANHFYLCNGPVMGIRMAEVSFSRWQWRSPRQSAKAHPNPRIRNNPSPPLKTQILGPPGTLPRSSIPSSWSRVDHVAHAGPFLMVPPPGNCLNPGQTRAHPLFLHPSPLYWFMEVPITYNESHKV